ncbi:transmembrane protein [Medicago truncatula]|uniref:Transmembrane protein n=1 Tax=Medicago truncatula TaxID=3880 RepID=A0A072TJG2_MEDTR|nr:transmembrane protein [Medicago truncatula]
MLADEEMLMKSENQGNMPVLQTATAVATSFLIYRATVIFFVVVGASGSILNVIQTAPSMFMFALVQVTIHLLIVLGLGKLFKLDLKLLLLASNAKPKGWESLVVPGMLTGIFGVSIATFLGIGFGLMVLKHL